LTAQNTQAAKDLNTAKDHARSLEQQLSELKSKGGGTNIVAIIAAIIVTAIITAIICISIS
jgi:predicted secreted Zn-dependent protease